MRLHLLAALMLAAAPLSAQSLRSGEVMSTLAVYPLARINPVLGSDDRVHLAYELVVTNPSKFFITLDKVEAVDPAGKVLASVSGDALARMTTRYSGSNNLWGPGQSGIVFMDVTLAPGDPVPASVAARMTITRQSDADGKPGPFPAGAPIPGTATFTGARNCGRRGGADDRVALARRRLGVGQRLLRCHHLAPGAVIAVNGQQNAPERFAIDWVQIGKDRKMYSGDGAKLTDFAFMAIRSTRSPTAWSSTAGTNRTSRCRSSPRSGWSPASIGGNMLVVDIGGGAFAFYAHFQRDSLRPRSATG